VTISCIVLPRGRGSGVTVIGGDKYERLVAIMIFDELNKKSRTLAMLRFLR